MRSKVIVLVVALVLGGIAAVMTAQYLSSARGAIEAESRPVEVLVAQQDIPRGTSVDDLIAQKLVSREDVPQRFVSAGAVSSLRAVEGQVLAADMSSGEQLTTGRFEYPTQAGLSYNVPEDFVAVTIPVDEVSGVSGFLRTGDSVAVFVTLLTDPEDPASVRTEMLLSNARVLAAGEGGQGAEGAQQAKDGGVMGQAAEGRDSELGDVTLAVPPAAAEKLVFVANKGEGGTNRSIWLAMLPVKSTGATLTHGQTYRTILK